MIIYEFQIAISSKSINAIWENVLGNRKFSDDSCLFYSNFFPFQSGEYRAGLFSGILVWLA